MLAEYSNLATHFCLSPNELALSNCIPRIVVCLASPNCCRHMPYVPFRSFIKLGLVVYPKAGKGSMGLRH